MSAATDITIPRETANDDVVRIVRWLVPAGGVVRAGTAVLEIETSKSVIEVVAPGEGQLTILEEAGREVPVGATVGRVGARAHQPSSPGADAAAAAAPSAPVPAAPPRPADAPPAPAPVRSAAAGVPPSGAAISDRARERLAALGIDAGAVAHLGMVRERDVEALAAGRAAADAAAAPAARSGESVAEAPPAYRPHGLFGDARRSARDRGGNVVALGFNYLWRNWFLGNLVRVAPVGVRNFLHRLRGVRMGRDCFIDPGATLETAYPENITLGDDVRVTAGAIVMTHIKAPHRLRDLGHVPVVVEPVRLGSHSFIGVNSVVMPGVTVGEGAVVASGAVVLGDVPPYTMVAGNPAKVVKRFA